MYLVNDYKFKIGKYIMLSEGRISTEKINFAVYGPIHW